MKYSNCATKLSVIYFEPRKCIQFSDTQNVKRLKKMKKKMHRRNKYSDKFRIRGEQIMCHSGYRKAFPVNAI